MWESPIIAEARLTELPEMLVALWVVISANKAARRHERMTLKGLLIACPLASLAAAGVWLLVAGWTPA